MTRITTTLEADRLEAKLLERDLDPELVRTAVRQVLSLLNYGAIRDAYREIERSQTNDELTKAITKTSFRIANGYDIEQQGV